MIDPLFSRRGFLAASAAFPVSPYIREINQENARSTETPVPQTLSALYIPRLQLWGFDTRDPILQAGPLSLSFQVFTTGKDENSFSLDSGHVSVSREGSRWNIRATRLAEAGQQRANDGRLEAQVAEETDGEFTITIQASCTDPIRAVKVRVHGLPHGQIAQTGWEAVPNFIPLPEHGINFNYPEYQGGMPVWLLQPTEAGGISFSSSDLTPRPKRFVAYRSSPSKATIELVFEQFGSRFAPSLDVPAWTIRLHDTLERAIERRVSLLETAGHLCRWEQRTDMPAWARDIRLVITLHGMHWSGYIFNDYRRMLEQAEWVTKRIEGKHVLFFLAGWEGRYYRSYGNSVPETRMGGADRFRELITGIQRMGAHTMAMYGGNYPSPGTPGYESYAETSKLELSEGFRWSPMRGYVVDWGQLRGSGMSGGGPPMNPGAPAWREFLTAQVSHICSNYGVDGAFFDTQPTGGNDAHYDPVAGLQRMSSDLRSAHQNLLIATESWFDLSLGFIPASQTPGGPKNWTRKYQRRFAHLSMGEPSRGSTGVHELGYLPYNQQDLLSIFDWPTIGVVENTFSEAPEKAIAMIEAAKH